jgi:coenzyme F420-reducing hydrogenase gamma subunit
MEEELLDLLSVIDAVEWREAISNQSDTYDIAIIEGSVMRVEDEERLKEIRERATILIAMGACATFGGVNKLANNFELSALRTTVYGKDGSMPHLETGPVKALHEVVKVDYNVQGCPIDASELSQIIRSLLAGKKPFIPNYPVCVECKLRENACRFEYGEVCLGPITRAGCDARCPSNGAWCFGCRGYVDDPNSEAMAEIMGQYGKSIEDLREKMLLFGSKQEFTV